MLISGSREHVIQENLLRYALFLLSVVHWTEFAAYHHLTVLACNFVAKIFELINLIVMNKGSLCSEQVVIYVYNLHNSNIYTCTISSTHRLTQVCEQTLSWLSRYAKMTCSMNHSIGCRIIFNQGVRRFDYYVIGEKEKRRVLPLTWKRCNIFTLIAAVHSSWVD